MDQTIMGTFPVAPAAQGRRVTPLRVISLGAGVQSTTMSLMAAHGELEMPDCAIFADTGWEPKAVYEHLDRLEKALPFPVHRVSAGNLRDAILTGRLGKRSNASVPFFLDGGGGMLPRQCTKEFKIEPIAKKQRELLGYRARQRIPKKSVEQWIGNFARRGDPHETGTGALADKPLAAH